MTRASNFAAIAAKATTVFGPQAAAEQWVERPAIGLDRHRPIETFLERLRCGVSM